MDTHRYLHVEAEFDIEDCHLFPKRNDLFLNRHSVKEKFSIFSTTDAYRTEDEPQKLTQALTHISQSLDEAYLRFKKLSKTSRVRLDIFSKSYLSLTPTFSTTSEKLNGIWVGKHSSFDPTAYLRYQFQGDRNSLDFEGNNTANSADLKIGKELDKAWAIVKAKFLVQIHDQVKELFVGGLE